MVFYGLSHGCKACRTRRVKCDEGKPFCKNCTRRDTKTLCKYRSPSELARQKRTVKKCLVSEPKTSAAGDAQLVNGEESTYEPNLTSVVQTLIDTRDSEAMCFFFTYFVRLPHERYTNIYADHIMPLYKSSDARSALTLAMHAVATKVINMWRYRTQRARSAYEQYYTAIVAMREAIDNSAIVNQDEFLAAVFLLDVYEMLNRALGNNQLVHAHHSAAMAFVEQSGPRDLNSSTTPYLLAALRSRYIWFRLMAGERIKLSQHLLELDPYQPGLFGSLDLLAMDLSNLVVGCRDTCQTARIKNIPIKIRTANNWHFLPDMINRALQMNYRLDQWKSQLPRSWHKERITDLATLHPSIHAAGVYHGLCDVYGSLHAAHSHNMWRYMKILCLQMLSCFAHHLPRESKLWNQIVALETQNQISTLLDDICASVPFHLGNRTALSLIYEEYEYPPIPDSLRSFTIYLDVNGEPTFMTDQDHARNAASKGGLLMVTPLNISLNIFETPQSLLSGCRFAGGLETQPHRLYEQQLAWMRVQIKRIHSIHHMYGSQEYG